MTHQASLLDYHVLWERADRLGVRLSRGAVAMLEEHVSRLMEHCGKHLLESLDPLQLDSLLRANCVEEANGTINMIKSGALPPPISPKTEQISSIVNGLLEWTLLVAKEYSSHQHTSRPISHSEMKIILELSPCLESKGLLPSRPLAASEWQNMASPMAFSNSESRRQVLKSIAVETDPLDVAKVKAQVEQAMEQILRALERL